jgi:hypothetical protein
MFYIKNRITSRFLFSRQISKGTLCTLLKTNMFNYVPIKHKEMSFVSNGGKFKLYTVLNGLIFIMPTQPRILFERVILCKVHSQIKKPPPVA